MRHSLARFVSRLYASQTTAWNTTFTLDTSVMRINTIVYNYEMFILKIFTFSAKRGLVFAKLNAKVRDKIKDL